MNHISIMLSFPKNIDSFLLRSSLGPYIKRDNPTAFAMGFSYLSAASFRDLGTPEGNWNARRATGTEPQTLLGTVFPLQGGVREGLFGRVVRLLQRAEEGCEGLKHGYYDLPCVHFLIFLCHDIKNKIDRLFFIFMNKISQNFTKLLVVFKKNRACSLFNRA